jgi:hypothetical protein
MRYSVPKFNALRQRCVLYIDNVTATYRLADMWLTLYLDLIE